jgi:hypothetical protein
MKKVVVTAACIIDFFYSMYTVHNWALPWVVVEVESGILVHTTTLVSSLLRSFPRTTDTNVRML